MMNYRYVNTNRTTDDAPEICDVLETTTNQAIKTGMSLRAAKDLCRHLNMGGGFDGFTPSFFLARIPPVQFFPGE